MADAPYEEVTAHRADPYHPHLLEFIDQMPVRLADMPHTVIHGPRQAGCRSIAHQIIAGFSPSALAWSKRIRIGDGAKAPVVSMSDVHFHVDMGLARHHTTQGWGAVFGWISDVVSARPLREAIVMCTDMHLMPPESARGFHAYMRDREHPIRLVYILVTKHLSALSAHVRRRCYAIPVPLRPGAQEVVPPEADVARQVAGALEDGCDVHTVRRLIYTVLTKGGEKGMWARELIRAVEWRAGTDAAILELARGLRDGYRDVFHLELFAVRLAALRDNGAR